MAYPVIPTRKANAEIARLNSAQREALYEALLAASENPAALPQYSDDAPEQLRILAWADGAALLLIDDSRNLVPEPALILLALDTGH